ncbi:MAG TPA: HAD-IA family hydrolase [archaeon]|nr:HAD-IA family hydrolase [archaeon]
MKPVIFIDFGHVYFKVHPTGIGKFSKKFHLTKEEMLHIFLGPHWTSHASGKTDEKTYWKCVAHKMNISPDQVKDLSDTWYNTLEPCSSMVKLVANLRKKYRVAALSSITAPWIEVLEKKYKISKHFHEHHYSFDHGIDKPDAKLFLRAARKMKVNPEDCIVVDDMKKFLDAVKKTGARTIMFDNSKHDVKQLETHLRKMGIEI